MDEELVKLLKEVAEKKLTIVQFTVKLTGFKKRLGDSFDSSFNEALNQILIDSGKSPVTEKKFRGLRQLMEIMVKESHGK